VSRWLSSATVLVWFLWAVVLPAAAQAQGGGYQGFGAATPGGAGGAVVRVTNLNDAGPGSLRDAVSRGNRTVVFDVGGEIALATHLYVLGASVTIDGFTAPAPGITLKNYGLIIRGNKGAHDVIVRGIRIRNAAIDGIQVAYGAFNVVIDHVSVTGSADGNIDITEGSRDVTVAWSIIGANGKNMLIKYNPSRITMHHNLLVASTSRNPQVRIDDGETPVATDTTADLRNNVVANWGSGYGTLVWYGPWANVVNNFYSSAKEAIAVSGARAYVAGNLAPGTADINRGTEPAPFDAPVVDTQEACAAALGVLAGAGVRPLDATDQQLVSSVAAPTCESSVPLLAATPGSLSLQAIEGGPDPPAQTLTVVDAASGAVNWVASAATSSGPAWLKVAPSAGTTPGPLSIAAAVAGLSRGAYAGTVSVRAQHPGAASLSIPVGLVIAPAPSDAQPLPLPLANRLDDGREATTGVVRIRESSLALGAGNLVAFRFAGVPIPQGATIGAAVLEVVPINRSYLATDLRLRYAGEAADTSPPFSQVTGSLSARPRTVAYVDHVPGAWTLDQRHSSPDLAAIVQEIVRRPGWRTGQALTILVEDVGSRGRRVIASGEDGAGRAAILTITHWSP
jgi:hypothetical protein